ncbi:MAG: hypothetical protein ACFNTB_04855, partial [Prevotella denticola]
DRAHPGGLLSSEPVVIALLSPASALVDLPVLSISAASVWPALLRLGKSHLIKRKPRLLFLTVFTGTKEEAWPFSLWRTSLYASCVRSM